MSVNDWIQSLKAQEHLFQPWADGATIATFIIAILGSLSYVIYLIGLKLKKWKLEGFLRDEKLNAEKNGWKFVKTGKQDTGARTLLAIITELSLSEEEIIKASFRSRKIKRLVHTDNFTNYATDLLFRYEGKNAPSTPTKI